MPAYRRSYAISVYFGFYQFCCCLPRRHYCARRDMRTIGRRRLGCTPTRSAERQRIVEAEANHIAKARAASVSNAATQVLPFRRHKGHSSPRLPIRTFLLGVQGGHSLLRKRMAPCPRPPARRGEQGAALCAVEMQFCILFTAR